MDFLKPEKIVREAHIRDDARVGDLGVGGGEFIFALLPIISPQGEIYAVDVQEGLLKRLAKDERLAERKNIHFIWGDLEKKQGSHMADGLLDVALVSNILFQIEDKRAFVYEVARIVRSGGMLVVVDWQESFGHMGPHPDAVVREEDAKLLFSRVGFEYTRAIVAGSHHYGLIFTKV